MSRNALWTGVLIWLAVATVSLPAMGRAQFMDEHFEPLRTPPDPDTYPETVQAAIEQGYHELELVAGPADEAHLEAAKEAFERGLELEPRAVHALNGIGIYELTKDDYWLVILESLKKILNRDHISLAIRAFENALAIDPAFHPARFNLALAYRQARGEENYRRAARELEKILQDAPGFADDAALLLAVTYRDAGELERLAATVDSLTAGDAFSPAGRQLFLAYALVNTGHPEEGATAYWTGLEAIATEREAELYWHDIRPIASAEADAEFQALDVEGRRAFLRAFWERLADQSFVSVGDRLAEHYRRLHHVYESFRLELPERRHYSSVSAYVPPWQTGFDDRGVIYLRHGEPDDVASHSGPAVERNVSWKYERPGGDPLIFHFVSVEDVEDYKLVRHLSDAVISTNASMKGEGLLDPQAADNMALTGGRIVDTDDLRILAGQREVLRDLYRSRGELDPTYDRAALDLDPLILQEEESRLAEDILVGTRTVSYEPELSGNPLIYPVDPVPFKDERGRPVVAFYYALPTTGVEILGRGGGSAVDYRYQIRVTALSDSVEVTGGRADEEVHLATAKPIPQDLGVMLPGVETLSLTPGSYEYGMKVTDLNSGRYGILEGSLEVYDFSRHDLALSGILLASRIEPAGDLSNPFVRWGRFKVLPLPSHTFLASQPVYVYYEIYGLTGTAAGEPIRYRTTYTLAAAERDRNVVARFFSAVGELLSGEEDKGSISYSFERTVTDPQDPLLEYVSLDVSESEPGDYTLSVELEDLVTGEVERREVRLTLVR